MTTPILQLDELEDSQSQPHVPLNASVRALGAGAQAQREGAVAALPIGAHAGGERGPPMGAVCTFHLPFFRVHGRP